MRHALAIAFLLLAGTPLGAQAASGAGAPQTLRIDHFVQRGAAAEATLHGRQQDVWRLCGGGLAELFGDRQPSHEVLLQWLQSVDVVAATARDLPFWTAVGLDGVDLVATNVRDGDGQPFGEPFHVETAGTLRVAVLAVATGEAPPGFAFADPAAALQQALPEAARASDAQLVVVDGDLRLARTLLDACPCLSLAIVTGDPRANARIVPHGARCLVHSPRSGTALGQLALQWDGGTLRATAHRFAPAFLGAWEQQQAARLRAAMRPAVGPEDDADVTPRGLAGCGIEPEAVNAAIARGAGFLLHELRTDEAQGARLGTQQEHLLLALALVHAGAHRTDAEFARSLRTMLQQLDPTAHGVYAAGVFCMLVEALGEPEFHGRLRVAARYLVEGQSASGSWTYAPKVDAALCSDPDRRVLQVTGGTPFETADAGTPANGTPANGPTGEPPPWQRTMPWNAHQPGDNSVTQFALLGLRSAQRCSVPVPAETWRRANGWCRRVQRQNGAFGYANGGSDAYGSMTLAGIASLAITEHELGNDAFAQDEAVRRGIAWVRANFAIDTNPGSGSYVHYWLYSLERTGRILDREVLAGQEWYPLGVRQLLATQTPDGSWNRQAGGEPPRLATSFALLFLTRATQQLHVELQRGGTGTLQTFARAAAGARVYVILDASGSMLVRSGDATRFDRARAAVEDVLAALPPGPQVAVRVYGHRKRAIDPGADDDTELLVPLGPFDRDRTVAALRGLRARGKTPLARSLLAAAADLRGGSAEAPTTVVLLTDGGEDSMPRQDPARAAATLAEVEGLRLHVVGFEIDRDDWRAQLQAMARAGRGEYLPADSERLAALLRAAVLRAPDGFVLTDAAGAEVHRGAFGDAVTLREGRYRLATQLAGRPFATELWVNTNAVTSVVFDGSLAVDAPADGDGGDGSGARHCPGCRAQAPAGARFCAACGARLGGS